MSQAQRPVCVLDLNKVVQYSPAVSSEIPVAAGVSRIHDAAIRLFAERGGQDISVSDLALAAGVARGTVYNNIARPEALFDEVAAGLAREMHGRITASMAAITDPAVRLTTGVRMFVRRAHEEPYWGRFIVRFGANDDTLRKMMDAPPAADVALGIESGRFQIAPSQLEPVVAMVGGAALAAMQTVLCGRLTWRAAGSEVSELLLRALGVPFAEAHAIAHAELAPLASAAPARKQRKASP